MGDDIKAMHEGRVDDGAAGTSMLAKTKLARQASPERMFIIPASLVNAGTQMGEKQLRI